MRPIFIIQIQKPSNEISKKKNKKEKNKTSKKKRDPVDNIPQEYSHKILNKILGTCPTYTHD